MANSNSYIALESDPRVIDWERGCKDSSDSKIGEDWSLQSNLIKHSVMYVSCSFPQSNMADSPSICFAVLQAMITDTGKDHDFLSAQMKWKKPWKKVLYEDQGVPDNYVDGSFLEEMKKNCEYCRRAFWHDL